jgi:lysozyme family protein
MPDKSAAELSEAALDAMHAARDALNARYKASVDPAEKSQIEVSVAEINNQMDQAALDNLLTVAQAVGAAASSLETAIASARLRPLDHTLQRLITSFQKLEAIRGEIHLSEGLDFTPRRPKGPKPAPTPQEATPIRPQPAPSPTPASPVASPSVPTTPPPEIVAPVPVPPVATPVAPEPASPVAPSSPNQPPEAPPVSATTPTPVAPTPAPPPQPNRPYSGPIVRAVNTSIKFPAIAQEYGDFFDLCQLDPARQGNVSYYLNSIAKGKMAYVDVGEPLRIPWYFIGLIHGMECGFDFGRHLHNGDPLTSRTVRVPRGHPKDGSPPFTWKQSASDVLMLQGLHQIEDWSIPHMLYLLEKYNGFGYRFKAAPTPYLWSFSNLYQRGRYVADGQYDPNAVSLQCGAGVILKIGKERGLF